LADLTDLEVTMSRSIIRLGIVLVTCLVLFGVSRPRRLRRKVRDVGCAHHLGVALARPAGDRRHHHAVHVPLRAARRGREADAGGWNTPSLAESWSQSKDGLTYEFVLRKGVKFHNGDPVTAEDVKFSYDRYRGAGVKLLKDRVARFRSSIPGASVRAQGAVAGLHDVLRHVGDRRGLGRAQEVHREGRDDGFKKAPIAPGPTSS